MKLGRSGQGVVRLIEWATGQPRIRRMYEHYTKCGRPPELFWHDAIAALRLDLRLNRRPADAISPGGRLWWSPTIPSACRRHHSVLAGGQVRADYQIMTHRVLHQAAGGAPAHPAGRFLRHRGGHAEQPALAPAGARAARQRRRAPGLPRRWRRGGAEDLRARSRPSLGPLAAKLALATGAAVLPVFFHGQNSRWFQAASNIHQTLRYALLFHEVRNKIGRCLDVTIGDVIANERLRALGDRNAVTDSCAKPPTAWPTIKGPKGTDITFFQFPRLGSGDELVHRLWKRDAKPAGDMAHVLGLEIEEAIHSPAHATRQNVHFLGQPILRYPGGFQILFPPLKVDRRVLRLFLETVTIRPVPSSECKIGGVLLEKH